MSLHPRAMKGQKIRQARAGNEVLAAETRRSQPMLVQPSWLTQLQLTQILLCFLVAMQMACLWTRSAHASLCKDPLCYYLCLCQILPIQAETVCTQAKQFWKIPVKTFLSDLKINLGNVVSVKVSGGN